MRSLSPLRLQKLRSHISPVTHRATRPVVRRGCCSTCEPPKPTGNAKTKATVITNPSLPPADHRQLGIEQGLFTNSIYSPGSPLFLPNGARIFNKLVAFLRAQYSYFGFEEVITPTIYKKSLWEKSGHWENYAEDMFSVTGRGVSGEKDGRQIGEGEEYGLKPMNCPGHCLLFASKQRSFRELPIRYSDFSPLHRNEISGALSGLTRVRRFHQDDGHIFCRPSQVGEEISKTLDFVRLTYETFNLGPYRLALSTRPKDTYIGTVEEWNNAEAALREALDASGQVWSVSEGDGAFYGPKIDIILKDSDGKEHQTATIQLDFQLPKRFELEYQAPAPELERKGIATTDPDLLSTSGTVRPVMIHRAVLGSVERFMALLIEHYNGRWPFWLNPQQAIILTVTNDKAVVEFARKAMDKIQGGRLNVWLQESEYGSPQGIKAPAGGVRARGLDRTIFAVDFDDSPRSMGKKISEAKRKRYGVIIVVGKYNVEKNTVNVNFSGVSDPHRLVEHELRQWRHDEGTLTGDTNEGTNSTVGLKSDQPKGIEVEPWVLRQVLLMAERAYL